MSQICVVSVIALPVGLEAEHEGRRVSGVGAIERVPGLTVARRVEPRRRGPLAERAVERHRTLRLVDVADREREVGMVLDDAGGADRRVVDVHRHVEVLVMLEVDVGAGLR